ncbi:uncharacterized protein LOC128708133 [Anopheles marshallii]|uniref:uncharacterized protein LOC128708133 n=1 Tax=Anopheles marshallii TaxID=1521116 RepID=UPI00237B36AA|nr:uncharacterized protein LOC128708133 [Anopheles marshallii]
MRLVVTLGVALLAIIGGATAKPSNAGSCSKNDEGITFGIATDCHKYLVCKKGLLEVKECNNKKYYDTVTGKCLKAAQATCAVESNPEPEPQPEPVPEPEPQENDDQYDYLCQKVLYGVRIHPNACDRYLVCNKEKATVEQCADGFIFVADVITCVPGNKVTCTIQPDVPSTTESLPSTSPQSNESGSEESGSSEASGSSDESAENFGQYDYLCAKTLLGSVAHPESCTKYISCYKSKAKETNCKKGYAYSSTLHLCVKQKNGGCADAPEEQPPTEATPVEPEPTRPGSEETGSGEESSESANQYDYLCAKTLLGSVAHPESCTKYISCYKSKAKEENCKKGYAYSSTLHLCVKQKNGGCADAPEEQPPTEASPVEPEPTRPGSEETGTGEESSESANQYDYLCVKTLLGSVAHPESCTKYISCYKNKAKEENCKKGYAYSSTLHLCVKQKNGGCADAPEEQPPTEATPVEPEPTRPGSEETGSGDESSESSNQYDYLCAKTLLGSVAHPESCTKYISCYKSKAKEENCKKGYAYSSTLHLCVKQKNGGCADAPEEQPPTEATPVEPEPTRPGSEETGSGDESSESSNQYDYLCAKTLLGSVAHPESCTKYISCYKSKAKEANCKKGYAYSSTLHLCVKQKNGGCADAPEEQPPTEASPVEPEPTRPGSEETGSGEESSESANQYDYLCAKTLLGSVAHPESCTKYISCYKSKAKEENCKKGYAYSSTLHLCVKQKNGGCADAPEEQPPTEASPVEPEPTRPGSEETGSGDESSESANQYDYLCAKTLLGSVAHPESCTKYISCYKSKAKEENCKKGYAYSSTLHLCVKQKNGGCADKNGGYETTTTTQLPQTTEAATTTSKPPQPTYETTTTTQLPQTTEAPTTTSKPPQPTYETTTTTQLPQTTEAATTSIELTPPATGGDPGEFNHGCVEGFTGYLPIENDCTSYVYCFQGEPGVRTCLEEYIYYDPLKACLPGDPVLCQLYSV